MRTRTERLAEALARGALSLLLAGTVTLLQGCDASATVPPRPPGAGPWRSRAGA
jgi:hypothetical protein